MAQHINKAWHNEVNPTDRSMEGKLVLVLYCNVTNKLEGDVSMHGCRPPKNAGEMSTGRVSGLTYAHG